MYLGIGCTFTEEGSGEGCLRDKLRIALYQTSNFSHFVLLGEHVVDLHNLEVGVPVNHFFHFYAHVPHHVEVDQFTDRGYNSDGDCDVTLIRKTDRLEGSTGKSDIIEKPVPGARAMKDTKRSLSLRGTLRTNVLTDEFSNLSTVKQDAGAKEELSLSQDERESQPKRPAWKFLLRRNSLQDVKNMSEKPKTRKSSGDWITEIGVTIQRSSGSFAKVGYHIFVVKHIAN